MEYLILSLLPLFLVGNYYRTNGVWATGQGAQLVRALTPDLKQQQQIGEYSGHTVALCVAFFGLNALRGLGLGTLAAYLKPLGIESGSSRSGSDGSDSSSGDGGDGGDGGSGCGGCGGCGGD